MTNAEHCVQYVAMPVPTKSAATIDRRLLRDDVYRQLRDAIVDGMPAPGEQLRDGELATWLGVSRTPVREALLRLAEAGLVVARPGRSTTVSSIEAQDVRDARDVVAAMHEVAVREAVAVVLEQFTPVLRRAERLWFSTLSGRSSVTRHEELIRLCAAGETERAAAVAFDTWHSLPTDQPQHDEE